MTPQSAAGAGWSKWGIVSLRFVTLVALVFYLGLQLSDDRRSVGATIGHFGTWFWVLFGVYVALNIVYAIEAVEAFVSQRITAGIFVVDVVLVCSMAFRAAAGTGAEIPTEFYLSYFLAILVAATSGRAAFAGGGSVVAGMVYALMATHSDSFESLMKGPFWLFLLLLISTALFVAILAGATRRQLGQKQGIKRALLVSSRLSTLFDLAEAAATADVSQHLAEFATEIGNEIFVAECRVYLRQDPADASSLLANADGVSPDEIARSARTGTVVLASARGQHDEHARHHSVIAAPISYGGTTYGALWVARSDPAVPELDADDSDLAGSLATHIGIALHNAQMLHEVETARLDSEQNLHKLRETQEALLRTEKLSAVGEIISRVAQELNTPLTNMLGTVELLQEQSPPRGRARHLLDLLHAQSTRCRALVSSMMKAVGRQKGNRLAVDLNELVFEVINRRQAQLLEDGIVIEYDLSQNLPVLMLDRERIARVVEHIVDNAHRAMLRSTQKVRRLTVQSWFAGDEIRLSIRDTGPGINLDNLLNVFQPFYSGDAGVEDTRRRGLGLAAAHQVMREHDGSVTATTGGEGGAEILLEFPRPMGTLKRGKSITERRQIARILLVDPDSTLPEIVQDALIGHAKVFPVTTAQDALDLLDREPKFDAAVVDVALAGAAPGDLRKGLVSRSGRLAGRILWTATGTVNADQEEVINRSGGNFLAKPFSLRELRMAVGSLIERDLGPRVRKTITEAVGASEVRRVARDVEEAKAKVTETPAGDE